MNVRVLLLGAPAAPKSRRSGPSCLRTRPSAAAWGAIEPLVDDDPPTLVRDDLSNAKKVASIRETYLPLGMFALGSVATAAFILVEHALFR